MRSKLPHSTSDNYITVHQGTSTYPYESLSENTILELQDMFLTNGFHQLHVSSIEQGRTLLHAFLDSLGIYQDVACLTNADMPLRPDITDISNDLFGSGCLDYSSDLEEFFIEQWRYDFMWIEATNELVGAPLFDEIKRNIISLKIDRHIPIIELRYHV